MMMRTRGGIVPDVRKIAVLRANGIGDYVFAVPALDALRAAYPAAEIVLLGKAWHAAFLRERPGAVDRVVVIPPTPGVGETPDTHPPPAAPERFFAEMARERFDLVLQLHGGGRHSNPFARRLGARLTAGLRTPDAAPLDRWLPYVYFQHEVMRQLEAVSLVGAAATTVEPRIAITPRDLAESSRICPETARPLAVLHPGAGDPGRRWPPEKFAAVGDALAEAGARVVVIGTAPERAIVAAAVGAMRADGVNLCDRLTLGGLAGLLSRAAVVVSNDSGPLHVAAACGAATVGIYWAYNVVTAGPLTTARHRPLVSWRLTCPICGADRATGSCPHQPSFVADVAVEAVTATALDLLAQETGGPVPSPPQSDRRIVFPPA